MALTVLKNLAKSFGTQHMLVKIVHKTVFVKIAALLNASFGSLSLEEVLKLNLPLVVSSV